MRESREDRVTLEAVTSTGLSFVLDCIYGGSLDVNSENMMDVIQAASYLQIGCAIKICASYLYETLTLDNLVQYSQIIERYGLDCPILEQQSVVECIANYVTTHFTEVFEKIGFSNLSYDVLKQAMSSNDLTCSELTIYDIVLEWIKVNPTQGKENIKNLVDCIHFLCMSEKMLSELKVSEEARDNPYLSEKIDKALHYLDPDTSLAERLEIGTPESLIRGSPSVIAVGGIHRLRANPVDAVQVLVFHEDLSHKKGCWSWGQSGCTISPFTRSSCASMDGLMFICGGRQPRKEKSRITNNCYIFDPVLWQLKEIANMNAPRTSYPLVACGGYVYAIGGACNYPNAHVNICQTIERYSLHDNCWKTVGYLPEPVYSHTAVSNGNLIYPVLCPKLTLIQPTWSAYPYAPTSLYGIHMPLLPYMVIQPIVLGMVLLWAAMDSSLSQGPLLWRHNDMTVIVSRNTRGPERDTQQRLDNANARRLQTVNR